MQRALWLAPAPRRAIVALDQGSGADARPLVAAGDRVRLGTPIGRAEDEAAVEVLAPIPGLVRAVEMRETASRSGTGLCVVIENDDTGESESGFAPIDWERLTPDELIARIRTAGIGGLGGAGFPAAVKLANARQSAARHLVLNGAECEPWICCDDALMRERASGVVLGARVMLHACGAERCTIAVENDKPESIAALERALASLADSRIELRVLEAVYPAGAERQLLVAVTGEEVPHDALPPSIGLLCQNVGTAAAVARLVQSGEPLTRRIVTVTGRGVREPANVDAHIGTPIADLVELCGGYCDEPVRLIAGGTMTGRALETDDVPVTQGINCVLVATAVDLRARGPEMPCIRCGECARVCPAGLLPQSLLRAVASGEAEQLKRYGLADCIECGCCDYACPSQIPLTARFRAAREAQRLRADELQRAADAKSRFARHERRKAEAADAERLEFENARRRARGEQVD